MRFSVLWGVLIGLAAAHIGWAAGGETARLESAPTYTFVEGEAEESFNFALTVHPPSPWPQEGWAQVIFNQQDARNGYYILLRAEQLGLVKVQQGRPLLLAWAEGFRPADESELTLCLQRRVRKIGVLVNNRLRLLAYDGDFTGGRLGYGTNLPNLTFADPLVQPTSPLYFADDFMRVAGGQGEWEPLCGEWDYSGPDLARPLVHPDSTRSANPFVYQGVPQGQALATVGYWFWDDYRFAAAVKPLGPGAVGLAVYVQDERNYLLFRWASSGSGEEREWVAVVDGQRRILTAASGGYVPQQWYRLEIRLMGEMAEALIDGEQVLATPLLDEWGQGAVGLYLEGTAPALFDDVVVESERNLVDDFSHPIVGRWQPTGGRWAFNPLGGRDTPGSWVKVDASGGNVVPKALTGEPNGKNYRFQADVKCDTGEGIGLCFYYLNEANYYVFRWGGNSPNLPYRQQCQLLSVVNGRPWILRCRPGGYQQGKWYTLAVEVKDGYFRTFIDGQVVFEGFDVSIPRGRAGFYADRAQGAEFDNARLEFLPPEPRTELNETFAREQTMESWASARGEWLRPSQPGGVYWHRGVFFREATVHLRLTDLGKRNRQISLLFGEGVNPQQGYALALQTLGGSHSIIGAIYRAGRQVARAAYQAEPDEQPEVRFVRRGRYVLGYVNDFCFIGYRDRRPLPAHRIGIKARRGSLDLEEVWVTSPYLYDTTFSEAPTDWWVARGVWETTSRWKCAPEWAWFGGSRHFNPVIWSKQDYSGNLVVEFYAAIQMDLPGPPHYSHPSDLNATICGNGRDVSSGYSFIFAGWNNTASRIFKNGHLLAESTAPSARFYHPKAGGDLRRFHRHWFRIRLEKLGTRLNFLVDDQLVLTCEDPHPLPGGKIALWTLNNGMLVARVRVWYENRGQRTAFPNPAQRLAQADPGEPGQPETPLSNDFEVGLGQWSAVHPDQPVRLSLSEALPAQGKRCLEIINETSGGEFAVRAVAEPFDALQNPILSFAYKASPLLKVNLHLKVKGLWHTILFAGPEELPADFRLLGAIPGVTLDQSWHRAEFNLGAALRKLYPNEPQIVVEEVRLANFCPNPYLYAAFGGNVWGTTYYLDDFRIGPK
ncbi:MAG TPA: hypothetical protein EYP85_10010 [Armatimonadetes bacterium]|nr:hypothetical protein [Armatimonadota bacterium]